MLQDVPAKLVARTPVYVGIVTDRPTTAAALVEVLTATGEVAVVGTATAETGESLLANPRLQLLLVNLSLNAGGADAPGVSFIQLAKRLRSDVRVLSLKRRIDETQARAALDAGADACCLAVTAASRLIRAIEVVASGATWLDPEITRVLFHQERGNRGDRRDVPHLSPRERQVLDLLIEGYSNLEIADRLVCSLPTVRTHLSHLYRRIGVEDRVSAAVFGLRHGLA